MTAKIGRGARAKGHNFERVSCRLLANWWGKSFIRVPLSGGWNKNVVTGDAFPIDENGEVDTTFPFSVEDKCQEGWELYHFLTGKGPFMRWFKQCERDCPKGKHALLIFKKNYSPVFAMIRSEVLSLPFESLRIDRTALQKSAYLFKAGLICFTWESFCLVFKPVTNLRDTS